MRQFPIPLARLNPNQNLQLPVQPNSLFLAAFWCKLSVVKLILLSLLGLILLPFGLSSPAQDLQLPSGWMTTTFPASNPDPPAALQCANYSLDEWYLNIDSGKLRVSNALQEKRPGFPSHFSPTAEMTGTPVVARAGDGWLVGFDGGLRGSGGGLWWSSENGREKKQLTDENVRAIVTRGNDLLVLTGMAHLAIDIGKVYSYQPTIDAAGTLVLVVDLGSAPGAAMVDKSGTVLIATHTRIVALDSSNKMRVLLQNNDMSLLYPHSIAEDPAGNIFVGMRFFILRLRPGAAGADYTPEWYVHERCAEYAIKESRCVCTSRK